MGVASGYAAEAVDPPDQYPRWLGDSVLAAGQGGATPRATSVVVKINPTTLKVDELHQYADNDRWLMEAYEIAQAVDATRQHTGGRTFLDRIAMEIMRPDR